MPQSVEFPLILTLRLDAASSEYFDKLRKLHFPPERNHLHAHVTAFHKLPPGKDTVILANVEEIASRTRRFPVDVSGLRFLGRGVAFDLEAEQALELRQGLVRRWEAMLSAQDRQRWAPHVTIQNKVAPEEACALFERLSASFEPFVAEAQGLDLWHYRGGPWSFRCGFDFMP